MMTDDPSTPQAAASEPTDVRFSIRSLLIVTIPVALLAAAMGAYFRRLGPDEQVAAGTLWGISATFVMALVGYHAWTRYRLEKAAGRKLLQLPPRGKFFTSAKPWANVVGGSLLTLAGVAYLFLVTPQSARWGTIYVQVYSYLFRGFICGSVIAGGISILWWNRAMQFRERGVLYSLRLLQWDHVTNCRWSRWTSSLYLEGVDQRHHDVDFAMIVPAMQVEEIGAVLAEKLALNRSQLLSPGPTVAVPFRLAPRRAITASGCLFGLLAFAGGIFYASQVHRYLTPEFEYACFGGALAAAAIRMIAARQTGEAGPPRVRLAVPLDRPVLFGWIVLAVICFNLGSWLSFSSVWIVAAVGLCAGLSLYSAAGVMVRDTLDLCEHGVVARHWMFWPWHTVTVRPFGGGAVRLSFSRGWTRVVAKVPGELHEAVDALLREKRSDNTCK